MTQGTDMAEGPFLTILFPSHHDEGVKLVEETRVFRQVIHKQSLQLMIFHLLFSHAVTNKDAMAVCVHHEHGALQ